MTATMRHLAPINLFLAVLGCSSTLAQAPKATALNWSDADSSRVATLERDGRQVARRYAVVYAPVDSLPEAWHRALADTLDEGVAALRRYMKAPYDWQRIGDRPIKFYLSPGRFVAHASGLDAVFIPLNRVHGRLAPFLHEASHELLAPFPPFYRWEYPDSASAARANEGFPLWLFEGVPDYLAQTIARQRNVHEGDVFEIGGLGRVDSVCAARATTSSKRDEILAAVGAVGGLPALFTTDRAQVAPIFYACGQSMTKHLIERIGIARTMALFPAVKAGTWQRDLERAALVPLPALRRAWLAKLGLEPADSTPDLRAFRAILDDFNGAFLTRDPARFTQHFLPDGDFMQAFGRYRSTRAATEDFMDWFLTGQTATFVSREVGTRVKMLGPDAAFVEAEFTGAGIKESDGSTQPDRRGQMMLALIRRDGRWQVASYRYLDIHPGSLARQPR